MSSSSQMIDEKPSSPKTNEKPQTSWAVPAMIFAVVVIMIFTIAAFWPRSAPLPATEPNGRSPVVPYND